MTRKTRWPVAALLIAAATTTLSAADRFSFTIPGDDSTPSITNMSWLSPGPCREQGFVSVEEGKFRLDGQPWKIWGVNLTFGANFPDKQHAPAIAGHLAKLGVNAVRLHHMDMQAAPQGFWRFKDDGTRELDPDQIDRLDFFLNELHQRGIYANINLHCSRTLLPEEGLPTADGVPWYALFNKYVSYFDPRVQQATKEFIREFLLHENPYRGLRRVDDPGIAVYEMLNENSFSTKGAANLSLFPPIYRQEFQRQWNEWLWNKYRNDTNLQAAWSSDTVEAEVLIDSASWSIGLGDWTMNTRPELAIRRQFGLPTRSGDRNGLRIELSSASEPNHTQKIISPAFQLTRGETYTLQFDIRADAPRESFLSIETTETGEWTPLGIADTLPYGPQWKRYAKVFTPEKDANAANIGLTLGDSDVDVEIANVQLIHGVLSAPLPENQTILARNIEIPGGDRGLAAANDLQTFMEQTELGWINELRSLLTDELGVHVPICASQVNYHGVELSVQAGDFADLHTYWNHPLFPSGEQFQSPNWWTVEDALEPFPLRDNWPTNSLLVRTGWRIEGMPFTLSEWNHCEPGRYTASAITLPAILMGIQDWDGTYFFEYDGTQAVTAGHNRPHFEGYFGLNSVPTKLALLTALAPTVRRQDIAPLAGVSAGTADQRLGGRLAFDKLIVADPSLQEPDVLPAEDSADWTGRLETPSGHVVWDSSDESTARIVVDTPRTKIISGFIAGQSFAFDGLTISIGDVLNDYAVVVLTSLTDDPITDSSSTLLTAVGSSENTAMQWNEERNSVGNDWGTGPTLVNGVSLSITWPSEPPKVHALTGTGERDHAVRTHDGTITVGPSHKTLWYELSR